MFSKFMSYFLLASVSILTGCANEPPKCSDEATIGLVKKIIFEQLGDRGDVTDEELKLSTTIKLSRASSFDEKIKKYNCEATFVAGDSIQMPIVYSSQLDDSNQHIVSVNNIMQNDLNKIAYAIGLSIGKSRLTNAGAGTQAVATQEAQTEKNTSLPQIREGTSYAYVRNIMIDAGWTPAILPDADQCSETDERCKDRPEMVACAGSGEANCKFAWKKDNSMKNVCTVGEDAMFSNFCD